MRNPIYILVAVVVMVAFTEVKAEEAVVYSFEDVTWYGPGSIAVRSYLNDNGDGKLDNLMIRMDPNDLSGASDVMVPKTGVWEVGFSGICEENGVEYFAGYANNNNNTSNGWPDLCPGWLYGWLSGGIFQDGERITSIVIVHDPDLDGIAVEGEAWLYVDSSEFEATEDNEAYEPRDILFGENQLRGDIHEFAPISYDGMPEILPKMVISPYRAYDPMYLDSVRVDFAAVPDLLQMAAYWLMSGADRTNGWMQGADWNLDGTVNMADFYRMSAKWNPPQAQDN